ncbi:uncharacterized protein ACBT57_004691 isoform 1-T1 [Dama dama]
MKKRNPVHKICLEQRLLLHPFMSVYKNWKADRCLKCQRNSEYWWQPSSGHTSSCRSTTAQLVNKMLEVSQEDPTSKERQLRGRRRAKRSYSTFKVRRSLRIFI